LKEEVELSRPMFNFEKLDAWNKAIVLANIVYEATKTLPSDERFLPARHFEPGCEFKANTPRRCAPPLSRGDPIIRWSWIESPLGEGCPAGRGVSGGESPWSKFSGSLNSQPSTLNCF
jgi:hypothetical protein